MIMLEQQEQWRSMMFKELDMSLQKNRDKMLWTDRDLWYFLFLGIGIGLTVGFLLGLSL